MFKIDQAKGYLKEMGIDGWLLYDFHQNNPLAHQFLEIPSHTLTSRRFFYWIPVQGEPVKLVHAIESHVLDRWPGEKRVYLSWQSLQEAVGKLVKGSRRVAMEYSPKNSIPYASRVDAGTVDLVRSFGVEVVSSAPFLPHFTAVLTEEQGQSHIRAGKALDRIVEDTWGWIAKRLKGKEGITEYEVQQKILADFAVAELITDSPPIVSVNAHSADPHYAPQRRESSPVQRGDWILIDLWAKERHPGSIFGDITRVGVAGSPSDKQQEVFHIVREAQVAATELIKTRFAEKKIVMGWEADEAARSVIREAGYGEYFIHRTGHNIGVELHGSGAHLDDLEMHDDRPLLAGTCFSVEPGIYLPEEFGVRLEYDLYVHPDGQVEIVGGKQDAIAILD